jgi:hypothetical protein
MTWGIHTRLLESLSEPVTIPNPITFTGQFTATGLQAEPGQNSWYVCSVDGQQANTGTSASAPVDSLVDLINKGVISAGDSVHLMPGHAEVVSTAGGITLSTAGVKLYFYGSGSQRAKITFTNAVATMLLTGAGIELYRPKFVSGADAIAAAVNPQAADIKIYSAEYYDAAGYATTVQVLPSAAAARLIIDGYKFIASTTGTQKTYAIAVPAVDGVLLRNIDIAGDFSTSPINNTATATNLVMVGLRLNNTNSGPLAALTLNASTTGFAEDVKLRTASGSTYYSSAAKIQWGNDCEGFSTDGYTGVPLGTMNTSGIEGTVVADLAVPAANASTNTLERDVLGNKTDAGVYMGTTTASVMAYLKGAMPSMILYSGTFTTSSATVPADTVAGGAYGSQYFKGAMLIPLTGSAALQPRTIADFATTTGVFTVDADRPFTAATGTVAYIIVPAHVATMPSADATTNTLSAHSIGNKTDTAVYTPGTTKSIMAYAKGTADMQQASVATGAAVMTNNLVCFTVGGPIELVALQSICQTANDGTGSTLQWTATGTLGTTSATITGATTTLATAAAGTNVSCQFTALSTAPVINANGVNLIANSGSVVVPAGTLKLTIGTGSTTGTWKHYIRYRPLSPGTTVVAAF